MRPNRTLAFGLALTVNAWMFVTPSHAQRGGGGQAMTSGTSADRDLLRPYGSRNPRAFYAEKEKRAYTPPPAAPPLRTRIDTAPRAAAFSQGTRNYFPAMRPGQGPNRNAINPRTLCVPGRRAMIPR